ncbi:MAG: hypothetical protein J2P51_02235, partial [Hyphomicrobiaceae bacterium]|nr:hypothetical protein [Hyphomicrobiaceae bacterium]
AKEDPSSRAPSQELGQTIPSATTAAPASPAAAAADEKKTAAPKAAKAKAKAKKNFEDAYRPPAPDWSSNPFADQMAPPAKE